MPCECAAEQALEYPVAIKVAVAAVCTCGFAEVQDNQQLDICHQIYNQ